MGHINQLKAGAVLSYVSIALNNVVGLIYIPFMLRMMGQNEYGLYSLAASVIAYLTVLDLGFANAIIRYTAKFRAEKKTAEQYEMFGMFFILYSVVGLIALLAGLVLCLNTDVLFGKTLTADDIGKMRVMLLLMTANLVFTFPMSIWGAIITAYEDFIFQKVINIVRIILNPLVMVLLLFMGYKAIAMVVVITVFNVLTLCANAYYCLHRLHIKVVFKRFRWDFLKEVSFYSFWIFLNVIMDRIYWNSGQFVLGMFVSASAVAVYAVAIQLQNIFTSFSTAISGVFLPKITAMVTHGHAEKEISALFIRTGRIQYLIISFVLIGFILFGKPFISLWAGSNYGEAYAIALLFFIPMTVPLVQNLGVTILQARNQLKFRSVIYALIALGCLLLSFPLARLYGGIGCAAAVAIGLVTGQVFIMNIYYYKQIHIDIPLFWKEILKMSITPALLGIAAYFVLKRIDLMHWFSMLLSITLFSLAYIPLVWFTSMNNYERNLLASPIRKVYNKITGFSARRSV